MGWFAEALAASGTPMLLSALGETVVYRPASGAARTITAIVDRNPPESLDGLEKGVSPRLVITVANSATMGISSTELDTNADQIEIADRVGGAATNRRILNMRHDIGSLTLELR